MIDAKKMQMQKRGDAGIIPDDDRFDLEERQTSRDRVKRRLDKLLEKMISRHPVVQIDFGHRGAPPPPYFAPILKMSRGEEASRSGKGQSALVKVNSQRS